MRTYWAQKSAYEKAMTAGYIAYVISLAIMLITVMVVVNNGASLALAQLVIVMIAAVTVFHLVDGALFRWYSKKEG